MHKHREILLDASAVGVGAAFGAVGRFLVGLAAIRRGYTSRSATLAINVGGSFALGTLAASSSVPRRIKLGLGIGFCGGFTTFSTFAVDIVALLEANQFVAASTYIIGTNVGSVIAAGVGFKTTQKILSKIRR